VRCISSAIWPCHTARVVLLLLLALTFALLFLSLSLSLLLLLLLPPPEPTMAAATDELLFEFDDALPRCCCCYCCCRYCWRSCCSSFRIAGAPDGRIVTACVSRCDGGVRAAGEAMGDLVDIQLDLASEAEIASRHAGAPSQAVAVRRQRSGAGLAGAERPPAAPARALPRMRAACRVQSAARCPIRQ